MRVNSSGFTNPMSAVGDLIIGSTAGSPTRLAAGNNGDLLSLVGGSPAWAAPSSTSHNLFSSTHSDTTGAASPVLGDLVYGNSTPKWAKLAGNTTATNKFLTQTGNGSVSAAPAWNTIASSDLPSHNHAATDITSGSLSLARGGTGASLSDPNANRLWGWDDTDNAISFITIGSGLSYDHSTHTLSATSSGDMVLASTQTNTGAKTFNSNTLLDKGSMVFNVRAYGAVGDDSTDDTTAIQNAIAAAGAVGGVVWFSAGTYKITTSLKLYNATPNPDVPYSNITIAGAGSSGSGGTIIKQYTTGEDVFKGLNNVTSTVQLLNVTFKNMCLTFGGTSTNSGNGIYLAQVAAGGPSFQGFNFENLVISNMGATGKYGLNCESLITSTINNVQTQSCANGFLLNGAVSGSFSSVNTSVSFINCYANGCTVNGYKVSDSTYISFVGCAADFASGSGVGYLIDQSSDVSFSGCGSELSGTFSGTLYKFQNGCTQCQLIGCFAYQNDNVAVQVTGSSVGITIIGFLNSTDTSTATTGLLIDSGCSVTDIDSNWGTAPNPDTPVSVNSSATYRTPGRTRTNTITSSATPSINTGATDEFTITALGAAITSMTTNLTGSPENGDSLVIRIKDDGTARAITWGASFASRGATLPTTTTISKVTYVGLIWNSTASTWDCVAATTEA